jgi:hypothetical protein
MQSLHAEISDNGLSLDPTLYCPAGAESSRLDSQLGGQFHLGCSGDPSLSHPGDLCCEGRTSAVGTNQCLRRPHPQDGRHKPLPEASTGQGHTRLLIGCPGRAALRKVLPFGPLAQWLTKPGEGRAGRRLQNESPRLTLGGELSFWGCRKGPPDTFFSTFRNLVTAAGPEQRGLCLGSDGALTASRGVSGCGVTPSCWEKRGRR